MSDRRKIKKEQERKLLNESKSIILKLKKISEELNLSKSQLKILFQENDFDFWKQDGMEEMMGELGLQGCLIPGDHIDISDEALALLRTQIDEDVRQTEVALNEGVVMSKKGPSIY